MNPRTLAAEFARVAAPVNPALRSNTKWDPVSRLIAEALQRADDDVYTATVSKAGNLSVRAGQSPAAQATRASVVVVMWTGPNARDFDATVRAVGEHCTSRDLVLMADGFGPSPAWTVSAIFSRPGGVPAVIASAWPSATVLPL